MLTAPSGCPRSVVVFDPNASYLSHFFKDSRKIKLGDCALFKAEHTLPLIGILRKLIVDKDGNLKLVVNWLYRPDNVKLSKGSVLEAAPNEIFYSFHRDEIPAISLLHPCKVAFLPKGVELPQDISSFLCRRVYDIANKRLCWLTDRYCTDEKQVEVNRLLDRTRQEMQASVPSPQKPKGTLESAQNGSISSQSKGKKRERAEQQSGQSKREKSAKSEDSEMCHSKQEQSMREGEIWEIANRGGALVSISGAVHLVDLMRKEKHDHHTRMDADGGRDDITRRSLLAGVIAATNREDCLSRFVKLGGLRMLDNWLQEAHKCKTSESGEEGLEELLLTLLRALERLPIDLRALKSCNVGKSVNNLRSHKNLQLQTKARKLVDTWKKRVDEEMKLSTTTDASKVASNPTISALGKANPSRLANDSSVVKLGVNGSPHDETFSSQTLAGAPLKEHNNNNNRVKDERSTSSSHSQNNSQSFSSGTPMAVKVKVNYAACSQTSSGRGKSLRIHSREEVATPTKVENSSNRRLILRLPNPGRGLGCISATQSPPISEKHDSDGKTGGTIHSPVGSTNTAKLEACTNNHKGSLLNHVSRSEVEKRKKNTPAVLIDDAHAEVRTPAHQMDTDGGGINLLASVAVSENSEEEKSADGNKDVDQELDRESMNDNDKGEKNAHIEGGERGEAKPPKKDAESLGEGNKVAMVVESLPEEARTEQSCVESQQQIPDVGTKCTDALATHDKVEEVDNGIFCVDPLDGSICQGETQENENACMDDNGESANNGERGATEASIIGDEECSIEVLAMELEHALEVESEVDGDVEVVEGEKEVPSIAEADEAAITQQSATLTESNDDMGRSEGHGRPLFDLNEGIVDEPLLPSACHPTAESESERKDSVATSAFRPVQTAEKKLSESGCDGLDRRESRALNIDLNIADESLLEEGVMMPLLPSQDSGCSLNSSFTLAAASSSSSRPVLDLNTTAKQGEESPEGSLHVSKARGNLWVMRDFDLNDGPLFEEEATESIKPLHLTKANNVGAHALLPGLVGAGGLKYNRMDSEAKKPTPSWPSSFHVSNKPEITLERSGFSPFSSDVCEVSSSVTFSYSPVSYSSSVPIGSTSVHEASIIRTPTWLRPSFDLNMGPLDGEKREEGMMNGGAALKRRGESESGFDPFRPGFHRR